MLNARAGAHILRHIQGPAAREYGQSAQQHLLSLAEQIVAPVDRGAECPMPRCIFAHGSTKDLGVVLQSVGKLRYRQYANACRGEVQPEWKPINRSTPPPN